MLRATSGLAEQLRETAIFGNFFSCVSSLKKHNLTQERTQGQRRTMPLHASPCLPMPPHGSLWLPIPSYAFLWLPMAPYGSLWLPLDPDSFLWIPNATFGCNSSYGFRLLAMSLYCPLLLHIASYGSSWHSMAPYETL